MFTLHHLVESRSQRIVWLLELVGADYEIKAYPRDPITSLAPQAYKNLHPLGAAPLLEHEGKMLAESGAICEYIVYTMQGVYAMQSSESAHSKHGSEYVANDLLRKDDAEAHINVQFWSHFSEGSFLPPLVANMVMDKAREKAKPFFVKFIANKLLDAIQDAYFNKVIMRNLAYIESHLSGKADAAESAASSTDTGADAGTDKGAKTFLVGDQITIADIQMSFGLEALYRTNHKANTKANHKENSKTTRLEAFPNIKAYVERLLALPSYISAMEKMAEAEAKIGKA